MEHVNSYCVSVFEEKMNMNQRLVGFVWIPTNSKEVWMCDYYRGGRYNPFELLSDVNRFVPSGVDDSEVLRKALVLFCNNLSGLSFIS